jgi:hypothetical protein
MLTKRDWALLIVIAILFVCAVNSVIYKCLTPSDFENLWTGKLSAWNDVALSLVAAMLWWYGLRTRYESGLPSIATIEFFYNGKIIMRCIDSNLPAVSSAREFSQSLGRELLKLKYGEEENLDMLLPTISIINRGIKHKQALPDGNISDCMDHKIIITLINPPLLMNLTESGIIDNGFPTGKCLTWKAPFNVITITTS